MREELPKLFKVGLVLGALSGCGVPRYDVPETSSGYPTVNSIVSRIECELLDMVRDDDKAVFAEPVRRFLLNGDYEVEATLSLDVNDGGGIAPSLSYLDPLKGATSFAFNASASLSESREHNFTENLQFSFRDLFVRWNRNRTLFQCPEADTNLAGDLGLKQFVALAAGSRNLDAGIDLKSKGPFGGYIQFIVIKNLSAIGPAWTLTHFRGPGSASLAEINTDKLTLAFATGPNIGRRLNLQGPIPDRKRNDDARAYLQDLQINAISTQLSNIPLH